MVLEFDNNKFRDIDIIKINPEFITMRAWVEASKTYAEFVVDKTSDEFRITSTAKSPNLVGILKYMEGIDILVDSTHISKKTSDDIINLSSDYTDNPYFEYGIRSLSILIDMTPEHVLIEGAYTVESTIPDVYISIDGANYLNHDVSNRIKIGESAGSNSFELHTGDSIYSKRGESIPLVKINNSDDFDDFIKGKQLPKKYTTVYPYEVTVFEL